MHSCSKIQWAFLKQDYSLSIRQDMHCASIYAGRRFQPLAHLSCFTTILCLRQPQLCLELPPWVSLHLFWVNWSASVRTRFFKCFNQLQLFWTKRVTHPRNSSGRLEGVVTFSRRVGTRNQAASFPTSTAGVHRAHMIKAQEFSAIRQSFVCFILASLRIFWFPFNVAS